MLGSAPQRLMKAFRFQHHIHGTRRIPLEADCNSRCGHCPLLRQIIRDCARTLFFQHFCFRWFAGRNDVRAEARICAQKLPKTIQYCKSCRIQARLIRDKRQRVKRIQDTFKSHGCRRIGKARLGLVSNQRRCIGGVFLPPEVLMD